MGSGWKKRAELGRLEAELSAVRRVQRVTAVRSDPRWRWAAWVLMAWAFAGPVVGAAVVMLLGR